MTVETATYISGLNPANPGSTDLKAEGDDHLRLTKQVLQNTFPNLTGAMTATHTALNAAAAAYSSGNWNGQALTNVASLTVTGAASIGGTVTSTAGEALRMQATSCFLSGYESTGTTRQGFLQFKSGTTGVTLAAETTNPLTFNTGNAERVRIDANGNIAVGNTPNTWFASYRAIEIGAGSNAAFFGGTGAAVVSQNSTLGAAGSWARTTASTTSAYQQSTGNHFWYSDVTGSAGATFTPTTRMSLNPAGQLLLGQGLGISSAGRFVASGIVSENVVVVETVNGSTANAYSSRTANPAGGTWYHFVGQSGDGTSVTTNNVLIFGNGNIQNTNNSYGAISDANLKQDIVDSDSQWNDVRGLRVRKYHLKSDPTGPLQIGFIAQEVETVSPGLVSESTGIDGTATKAVAYSVAYMKAFKALQEAMVRIEALEAKVA